MGYYERRFLAIDMEPAGGFCLAYSFNFEESVVSNLLHKVNSEALGTGHKFRFRLCCQFKLICVAFFNAKWCCCFADYDSFRFTHREDQESAFAIYVHASLLSNDSNRNDLAEIIISLLLYQLYLEYKGSSKHKRGLFPSLLVILNVWVPLTLIPWVVSDE